MELEAIQDKGELWHKINLWSNNTLVPSRPFSENCFHDNWT